MNPISSTTLNTIVGKHHNQKPFDSRSGQPLATVSRVGNQAETLNTMNDQQKRNDTRWIATVKALRVDSKLCCEREGCQDGNHWCGNYHALFRRNRYQSIEYVGFHHADTINNRPLPSGVFSCGSPLDLFDMAKHSGRDKLQTEIVSRYCWLEMQPELAAAQ